MTPPISIDGTDITGATIDGTDVQEITVDGDVVFSAAPPIPDIQNLHARYDARNLSLSDGQTVTSWPDEVASADLSAVSSPKYVTSAINGVPAVEYDGVDDRHDASFASSISDPYSIFFSGRLKTRNDGNADIAFADNPVPGSGFVGFQIGNGSGSYKWKINGGSDQVLGTNDTNAHIFSALFNNGTGTFREDSQTIASKNSDSDKNDFEGISLARRSDGFEPGNIEIVEVLVYSADESSNQTQIENYLDRDLGLI